MAIQEMETGSRTANEALRKGEEFRANLANVKADIEQLITANPDIGLSDIKIMVDQSLDVLVLPDGPVSRSTDGEPADDIEEPFEMVLSYAVPVETDKGVELEMRGHGLVSPDGKLHVYSFNPLDGHDFRVFRSRQITETVAYRSGVALQTTPGPYRLKFTLY